ncbi:uncharacterized protein LOC130178663 [Seriola aureovittata]|uniref:uncharacterized protein LOC130178663 n=1 Tax=Seriola aureovittata TaxID=2871759 RepID=UPI0024BE83CD|nr:uncharacterized protein LOC130178663 [Seriola aureovittata]
MTDTTTAADIFTALVGALDRVGVDWSRAVSLATDGLNHRQFDSPLREKDHNYGLPYHTELLAKAEHYAWVAYWDHSSATLLPAKLIPISSRLFGFQFPSSHQKIYCLPILTETSQNDLATMDPADTASDPTLLHKAISSQASPSQNPAPEPAPPLSPLRDFYTTIPELFSGELDECRRFLLQCDMVFQQWPLTLDSDRSKFGFRFISSPQEIPACLSHLPAQLHSK